MIRLRRDGTTPLRFLGHPIATGGTGETGTWHELALYAGADGGYAVAITAYRGQSAERFNAWLHDTLEEALCRLEGHDAARDVCPGLTGPACDSGDPAIPPLALAAQAAELRAFCLDVQRRYRTAVGTFLARIAESEFIFPP